MTAWEYLRSRDESELAALGREGWELVAVLPGEARGEATFYFKRPVLGFRESVTLEQKRRYYTLTGIQVSEGGEGNN